jgi:hypothetical protein
LILNVSAYKWMGGDYVWEKAYSPHVHTPVI